MNNLVIAAGGDGSGVDFTNLGGIYQITASRSGTVTFHLGAGEQLYDSAPRAATLDLLATLDQPLGYATMFGNYQVTATIRLIDPNPGESATYTSQLRFHTSTIPTAFFGNISYDSQIAPPGATQLQFNSADFNLIGNVSGNTFDLSSLSPGTITVSPDSLAAQAVGSGPSPVYYDYFGFDSAAVANPEPATFVLMGSTLLLAGLLLRKRCQRA